MQKRFWPLKTLNINHLTTKTMNPQINAILREYEAQLEAKRELDNRVYARLYGDRYQPEEQ